MYFLIASTYYLVCALTTRIYPQANYDQRYLYCEVKVAPKVHDNGHSPITQEKL